MAMKIKGSCNGTTAGGEGLDLHIIESPDSESMNVGPTCTQFSSGTPC